jgi:ribosomal protein S18 acetylase RimI-like enzyme
MTSGALECRLISPEFAPGLATLFDTFRASGTEQVFHPHPLTHQEALKIANYRGNDLYYLLTEGPSVLGYGMLRGWDEGYEIPSLGVALDPSVRGQGYGSMFMHFLHAAAWRHGAKRVRLTVHRDNVQARALYQSLGYVFQQQQVDPLIGYLELRP